MTDPNAPAPGSGGQQNIAELERAIDDARQKLAAMLEQQRSARTQVLMAFVALLVIVAVWVAMTASMAKANFSKETVGPKLKEYGPHFASKGRIVVERFAARALPVYQELAVAKLQELGPELRASAEQELSTLAEELDADLTESLNASLSRIESAVDARLREAFPYLAEGEALKALIEQFDAQHATIETDLQNMVEQEMNHLRSAAAGAFQRSFNNAAPVYRNLAVEKMEAMAPQLRASAEDAVTHLAEGIQSDIDHVVIGAMARIEGALDAAIREKFPYVKEGQAMDHLMDQLHDQHAVIQTDLNNIFNAEVSRAKSVLVKFNVPEVTEVEAAELEKDLLEAGLKYALYELHVSGTDEGLPWGDVLRSPRTMNLEPVGDLSVLE